MNISPEFQEISGAEHSPKRSQSAEEAPNALQAESPEASAELEKREITTTIEEINTIDQDIYVAQKSVAQTRERLNALRESIGLPLDGTASPSVEFQSERIRDLEERKRKLGVRRGEWIQRYGRESLPNGLAIDDADGGREAKATSFKDRRDEPPDERGEKGNLEVRRQWFKEWEAEAIGSFERAMRQDWRTKDAVNLELTIQLMKLRVPKAMEKEADGFLNGKTDEPSFVAVWLRWQTSSVLERILNQPNHIAKLEITFDDEASVLASDGELKKVPTGPPTSDDAGQTR